MIDEFGREIPGGPGSGGPPNHYHPPSPFIANPPNRQYHDEFRRPLHGAVGTNPLLMGGELSARRNDGGDLQRVVPSKRDSWYGSSVGSAEGSRSRPRGDFRDDDSRPSRRSGSGGGGSGGSGGRRRRFQLQEHYKQMGHEDNVGEENKNEDPSSSPIEWESSMRVAVLDGMMPCDDETSDQGQFYLAME